MLVLFTIFLYLLIPLVMLLVYLVRPRLNVQGFLAVVTVLAGWILIFLARPGSPRTIQLPIWRPTTLFSLSPSLFIDESAWFFLLSLASLVLAVIVTSIAQLGQSLHLRQEDTPGETATSEAAAPSGDVGMLAQPFDTVTWSRPKPGWLFWALILVQTSLGLVAVAAGNILTLLLAWAAMDIIELVFMLGLLVDSRTCERVIVAFSAKMAGLCLVLITGVLFWPQGGSLQFESISAPISTLLVLAAGMRLGVLPLHLPFPRGLPIDRNLGTILRLVPAASCFILLMRVAEVGVTGSVAYVLVGLTILAGVYAAVNWLRVKDEIDGQPFWLIASSSLVVISAILKLPTACLVWSLTSLLSGGLVFSMPIRHKNLLLVALLGIFCLSALPFSPAWRGLAIYQNPPSLGVNPLLFAPLSFFLLLIQAFLLSGFIRHVLKGIFPAATPRLEHIERWVWFLYPLGLVFITGTDLLIGWAQYPALSDEPLTGWLIGLIVLILACTIIYLINRSPQLINPSIDPGLKSVWDRLFSFSWLYRTLWRLFRSLTRIFALVSTILEGEGGLLWALVIFGLIFVFLQR